MTRFLVLAASTGHVFVVLLNLKLIKIEATLNIFVSLLYNCNLHSPDTLYDMGLDASKPAFGVSDKARLKPVSSATETSYKLENLLVANLDVILSIKRITKALIRLR